MKHTNAVMAAALMGAAVAAPQGSPDSSGCESSYDGEFTITIIAPPSSKVKRQQEGAGPLTLTLKDGILKDQDGRTGSIVANHQFQFDNPVQEDAIYTSGFSVCQDNLLAINDNKKFYKCASGDFSNLYDESLGEHCFEIAFTVSAANGSPGNGGGSSGGSGGDQPSVISDGQPQGPTGTPSEGEAVTQISDGQPQAPTGEPVSQIPDGQPQAPTGEPVSQIPDGQPQAPTGEPVSQIPDGQPQAPTVTPPQPTGEAISQIPDGQPQAPTGSPAANTSIPVVSDNIGGRVLPGSVIALGLGLAGVFFLL